VTISAAERDHARASNIDEETYARNKLKAQKMKRAGVIKD
jgi:hypothetical protein